MLRTYRMTRYKYIAVGLYLHMVLWLLWPLATYSRHVYVMATQPAKSKSEHQPAKSCQPRRFHDSFQTQTVVEKLRDHRSKGLSINGVPYSWVGFPMVNFWLVRYHHLWRNPNMFSRRRKPCDASCVSLISFPHWNFTIKSINFCSWCRWIERLWCAENYVGGRWWKVVFCEWETRDGTRVCFLCSLLLIMAE